MATKKRKAPKRPAAKKQQSKLPEHLENVEYLETGRRLIKARGNTPGA